MYCCHNFFKKKGKMDNETLSQPLDEASTSLKRHFVFSEVLRILEFSSFKLWKVP